MTSPANFEAALDMMRRANAPQTPLLEAAAVGRIALAYVSDPGAQLPCELSKPQTRPTIVLVGDDPPAMHTTSLGPDGWQFMRRLRYWQPRRAFIHGTGGRQLEYQAAVDTVEIVHRLLIVDTSSAMAIAWRDRLDPICPCLVLLPSHGVHPIAEAVH
jgi:hypothetical protein